MLKSIRPLLPWIFAIAAATAAMMLTTPAPAASGAELTRDAQAALSRLYAKNPKAKELGRRAVGVLVFPSIVKAGIGVSGQYGEGVLLRGGKAAGYYNTAGAAVGIQFGAQSYGYAMFFLSEQTLAYLNRSQGFEVGVGPSVVLADEAFAKSATSSTVQDNIYAFIFDNKGAMASVGLQGTKITKITK
jgi:lipid-binding SYLF domain-containing protein